MGGVGGVGGASAPRSTRGYLQQVKGDDAVLVHVHRLEKPCGEGNSDFFFFRGKRGKNEAGVKGKSWKKTGQDLRGKVGKSRQDLKGKVGKSQQDLKGKIRKTEQDLRGEVGKNRI